MGIMEQIWQGKWMGRQREETKRRSAQRDKRFPGLRLVIYAIVLGYVFQTLRAGEGEPAEDSPQGAYRAEPACSAATTPELHEGGCWQCIEAGPESSQYEEKADPTTGTFERSSEQEGRAMDDLQTRDEGAHQQGKGQVRHRISGVGDRHQGDTDSAGQGYEWSSNYTTRDGHGGRDCGHGRDLPGRREGHGDKDRQGEKYGRSCEASTSWPDDVGTADECSARANELHGEHDDPATDLVAYETGNGRRHATSYDAQERSGQKESYRTFLQTSYACGTIRDSRQDQGEQYRQSGWDGRLWTGLEQTPRHGSPLATVGYGVISTDQRAPYTESHTKNHQDAQDGLQCDRILTMEQQHVDGQDMWKFHNFGFTMTAETLSQKSTSRTMTNTLTCEAINACDTGHGNAPDDTDPGPSLGLGLFQKRISVWILVTAKAWDEDFIQTMQDRRAAQILNAMPTNQQDWTWARRQAHIPSPRQSPRLQIFRSTDPVLHEPAWHRFFMAHDTQPIDLVRRIQTTWLDLARTDGQHIPWDLHLVDRMVLTSNVIPNDFHTYILIADDETGQTSHETTILLEIQRKENTDAGIISTVDARIMARLQTKPTALGEMGLLRQCATTYFCTVWRNGNTMRSEPVAWEIGDYIVVYMAKQKAMPMPTGDPERLDQTFFEPFPEQAEPDADAETAESEAMEQHSPDSPQSANSLGASYMMVIRRTRTAHATDLCYIYPGENDKPTIAEVARTTWPDLTAPQPTIYDVHPIFYADFPFDRTIYWVIAVDENEFRQRPILRAVLVHLRKDRQRDVQTVALATATSEYGLLSWARMLIQCKRTNTHKCAVSHNGRLIQGSQRVSLQHGDYVRIETQTKDAEQETAELIPIGEGQDATPQKTAFWPPKPNIAPKRQEEKDDTKSALDTKRTRVHDGLHMNYWLTITIYIWLVVPYLIATQTTTQKPTRRRRALQIAQRKHAKAILFATLLLGQHCGLGLARQTLQVERSPMDHKGRAEHWTLNSIATPSYDLDPTLGLRPPGNIPSHLQLTDQGRYMYGMIVRKMEATSFHRDIRRQMQTIARPLVHRRPHVHRQDQTPAPEMLTVPQPVQISLENALRTPGAKTALGIEHPCTEQGNTHMAEDHRSFQGSTEGAPYGETKGKFSLQVGIDVFESEMGLCNPWNMPKPRPLTDFVKEIPPEYPRTLTECRTGHIPKENYIHIYTDGSATQGQDEPCSSWAAIIMTATTASPQDHELTIVDWLAGVTQDDPLHPLWIGTEQQSSKSGEGEALIWALLWALQDGVTQQLHLHVDANSILHAATGRWGYQQTDHLLRRVRATYKLLWTLIGDKQLHATHIKAHAGHAANELADLLAKHVRIHPEDSRTPEINLAHWMHGEPPLIEWAWAMIDPDHREGAVSSFQGQHFIWTHWQKANNDEPWLQQAEKPQTTSQETKLHMTILTYNVATLKQTSAAAMLRAQLHDKKIQVAGLQETRATHDDIPDSDFIRFIAKADKGVGGCEIWFSKQHPYATKDKEPLCFRREQFQVTCSDPQFLIINAEIENLPLTFAVAHAPNQGHGEQKVLQWWERFKRQIQKVDRNRQIILLIDANTQVTECEPCIGSYGAPEATAEIHQYVQLLKDFDLFCPSTYENMHKGASATWTSNDGQTSRRIDYIAIPSSWKDTQLQSYVDYDIHAGAGGIDHSAVCLEMQGLLCRPLKRRHSVQFDRSKLAHATDDQWRSFFDNWPQQEWEMDPTTQAAEIEKEIQTRLVKHFPCQHRRRRNTLQFSQNTWGLFQERNWHRRVLSAHGKAITALRYDQALRTWNATQPMTAMSTRQILYALRMAVTWKRYHILQQQLRKNIRQDRSDFLQQQMTQLEQADKGTIMQCLKHYRLGKRVKDLGRKPLPIVRLENGQTAGTTQEAMARWRRHYATLEGGSEISPEQLRGDPHNVPKHLPCELHELPTVFELERTMRAARIGKAMGYDGVPPELLHYAPERLAHVLWPLFLKQSLTVTECLQHKGGRLISAYKRRGDIGECANHCALLVSSCLAKAFHGAYRARSMKFVTKAAGPLQLTAQSHPNIAIAAQIVRSHLQAMKLTGQSSFALFVDISNAFYRVLRQFAVGADFSDEHVLLFLKRMGVESFSIQEIAELLEKGPALRQLECPDFLHAQISEIHRSTWWILTQDHQPIRTEKGTRPGDGFADVLWSLVFAQWLARFQERLIATGAYPPSMWNGQQGLYTDVGDEEVQHAVVIWADDAVVLGSAPTPTQIVAKLQYTCSIMVQELVRYGLQPNFREGKTEAIVDPRGRGATAIRRKLFQEDRCRLNLETPLPDEPALKLVASYKHLGGILTHGSKLIPEVRHRIAQGLAAYNTYRTKVYNNPKVPIATRMVVLRSTSLSAIHYNAATWTDFTNKAIQSWHAGHLSLYRRVLHGTMPFEQIRHLRDDEVLQLVDEPSPREQLSLLRLRWFGAAMQYETPTFWATLAIEKKWLQLLTQDLTWMYTQLQGFTTLPNPQDDMLTWHLLIRQTPGKWKGLIKRASLHARLQRRVHVHVAQYHRRFLQILADNDVNVSKTVEETLERAYCCLACNRVFACFSSWSVHAFKQHGRINKWRRLQHGCICKACGNRYPSEQRLLRHLQFNPQCAATVASLRLWVEPKPGIGSTEAVDTERQLALATWDKTDTQCVQQGFGWPMTEQVQDLLRWCTTCNWTTTNIAQEIHTQLCNHVVHYGEIEEIKQALAHTLTPEQKEAMDRILTDAQRHMRPPQTTTSKDMDLSQCLAALPMGEAPNIGKIQRTPTKFRYILHLFSGVRRRDDLHTIIDGMPAINGVTMFVASLDVVLSQSHGDLLSRKVQNYWLNASKQGAIFATISGPPCESWSISREHEDNGYKGPKPLRDGQDLQHRIWALATLRARDLLQVDTANQLLLFTVLLFVTQLTVGAVSIIEHPILPKKKGNRQPASIWLLPVIQYLKALTMVHSIDLWQGYFGSASPKPTTLLITAPNSSVKELTNWANQHRSTQNLPPPLKMGPRGDGTFATAPLKRYPPAFCRAIGGILHRVASKMQHVAASQDNYEEIFAELKDIYENSNYNQMDGADYAG